MQGQIPNMFEIEGLVMYVGGSPEASGLSPV